MKKIFINQRRIKKEKRCNQESRLNKLMDIFKVKEIDHEIRYIVNLSLYKL